MQKSLDQKVKDLLNTLNIEQTPESVRAVTLALRGQDRDTRHAVTEGLMKAAADSQFGVLTSEDMSRVAMNTNEGVA